MLNISIVCATIDSAELVSQSIDSIVNSCRGVDVFVQFVLVDQNIDFPVVLDPVRAENFSVKIIRSNVRGLSLNRNVGLREAKSEWCMFWDADCLIDVDFFANLIFLIKANPMAEIFFGKIVSIEHKKSILRRWPLLPKKVTHFGVWQLATSVNGVWKRESIGAVGFDERFGIGAKYGSCEDVDFYVGVNKPAYYSPDLVVCHPYQDLANVGMSKALSYSYGFGALCAKHAHGYGVVYFILSIIKKVSNLVFGGISFRDFKLVVLARVNGFFDFFNNEGR